MGLSASLTACIQIQEDCSKTVHEQPQPCMGESGYGSAFVTSERRAQMMFLMSIVPCDIAGNFWKPEIPQLATTSANNVSARRVNYH
jgi:hypothetical protein